ncbi:MAG: N-acetyltransferase [Deltaproteobacteria bacterium]|nr:N-acetyltransferase [Deltaproteobacteria bacterium]
MPFIEGIMGITLRLEGEGDHREVENLVRDAFWDVYKPGCDEHLVLHQLRNTPSFVRELDFVACADGQIIGHIVYSKAEIVNDAEERFEVLCMGPISVLPEYQRRGIGSLLLRESIKKARLLKYKAIVIYGNPGYYGRFGFRNAEAYHITTSDGQNFDPFMVLDISHNGLAGIAGRFFADAAFNINENELAEFETLFPHREKHVTDTQLKH